MTAELGHFLLDLALAASLAQAALLLSDTRARGPAWHEAGRYAAVAGSLLVLGAFGALAAAFMEGDHSLRLVAALSGAELQPAYRLAALWSGREGVAFLWAALLAAATLVLRFAPGRLSAELADRALGVLGCLMAGLVAVILAAGNPFGPAELPAVQGGGLDPLLQYPAMVVHAPLLIAGNAALAVAFALAVAAMVDDRLDAAWARGSRPWALLGWTFLSLGIAAGSLWSDREPAWGQWWSWGRLESASLVTWLAATALIHALPVAEKRGLFRAWTAFLAVATLSLGLLGTWLASPGEPGVVSRHVPNPAHGAGFLAIFVGAAGGALLVFLRRKAEGEEGDPFELISREAALATNGMIFLCSLGVVLLGLLQPYLASALGAGRGVSPDYYYAVFIPLIIPALLLMGPGPRLRWSSESDREALRDSARPALAGLVAACAGTLLVGVPSAWLAVAIFLAAWIAWHGGEAIVFRWRREGRAAVTAGFWAMHLSHFGVAFLVAGAALSAVLERSGEVVLAPGTTASAASVRVRPVGVREVNGAAHRGVQLRLAVIEGDRETVLDTELRFYHAGARRTAVSAVDRGLARDLQVHIVRPAGTGSWAVRVRVRPFMSLVWSGMLLMAAGGIVSMVDRRFRNPARRAHVPAGALEAAR